MINSHIVRQILNRNAHKLNALDFILADLAKRLMSRLDYIKIKPQTILECGSGLGFDRELLVNKYPKAAIIGLDIALSLLHQQQRKRNIFLEFLGKKSGKNLVCADVQNMPIANLAVDFVYANLLLPYLPDISIFICELRRVLNLGGSFCISGLGVDSFKELREIGLSAYVFPDMHDIGDLLIAAGFSNPVVDTEYITIEYDNLATLISDIRLIGCGAAIENRSQHIFSKESWRNLKQKFALPTSLTIEMYVAHGWKDQAKIDLPEGYSPVKFIKNK